MNFSRQYPFLNAYIYMISAGISFALMLSSSKVSASHIDPLFIAWLRGLGGSVILLPYMLHRGISIFGKNHKKLFIRSFLGTASVCFVFYSASLIPVADAVSLFKTSTLYVPFLAAYFLEEYFDSRVLLISAIGFLGVILVIQPTYGELNLGIVLALIAGFLQALIFVTLRGLSKTENAFTTVFYFLMGSALFLLPFISWPNLKLLQSFALPLATTVIAGLLGQLCLTSAYANAPAARVTPFLYSEVLFSAVFGWMLFNECPTLGKLIGMTIICGSGVALASNSFGKSQL